VTTAASAGELGDEQESLLYLARVRTVAAPAPIEHAIYGRVFEPELTALPPTQVAPMPRPGQVRVRALDQLVLALAGCLTGTLQGALEARRVPSAGLRALVEGRVVLREGRVRLASVHARYTLPVPQGQQDAVQRALAVHERACPASRSVQPAIHVTWEMAEVMAINESAPTPEE
jgi:uncharacterized OsmC-like protein